jgi:hypothetical protein
MNHVLTDQEIIAIGAAELSACIDRQILTDILFPESVNVNKVTQPFNGWIDWMTENIGPYKTDWEHYDGAIYFKNKKDKMLFMLRWL